MTAEAAAQSTLLTGGTGFVGTRVARALRARGLEVRCLVRDPRRASSLEAWGCELVEGDMTVAEDVRRAVDGVTQVVHLVSIIHGSAADFDAVMAEGTSELASAAREAGCERFVLMSALGVTEESRAAVPYYASKWAMEQLVAESGLPHVILRPGFVFGRGGALTTFARQVRLSPVVPVAGSGQRRLQPIWVEDVGAFVAASADGPDAPTGTFELAGPDVVTWDELYEAIAATLEKRRRLLHVPMPLLRVLARPAELLPSPPVTRDQLTMLELADNVCDPAPANTAFGIEPIGLREMLERSLL